MARLSITALVLTVVGVLWWLSGNDRSATVVGVATVADEETKVASADAPGVPSASGAARRQQVSTVSEDPTTSPGDNTVLEPVEGRCIVAGQVVDGDGGRALAGFQVVLDQPYREEQRLSYVTDAEGNFETPAVWQAGMLSFDHEPSPDYPGDWRITTQAVSLSEGLERREVELVARHADQVVAVDVVLPNGEPAVGAKVMHVLSAPDPVEEPTWRLWGTTETDAEGRAHISLLPEEANACALAFSLREPFEGHAADRLIVRPPVGTGPWQLELYRGGSLEVRVVDDQGLAVVGTEVYAYLDDRIRVHRDPPRATDSRGVARFESLAAGPYVARTRFPGTDEWIAGAEVELAHSAFETVELTISSERMPRVAAAGRVLDVDGEPVEREILFVRLDEGETQRVFSKADGTFEFLTPASGERVHLHVGASIFSEPYARAERSVDFGATNVEFRKTVAQEPVVALFEVADARTGELLPDAADPALVLYREPDVGKPVIAVARFGLSDGVTEVDFLAHTDLRYWITAPGYGEARGRVFAPGPDGAPKLHRIDLQPGFERELEIRDASSGVELMDVRFVDESGRTLATSGARGEVRLSAGEWPGPLRIEHEGYSPLEWDPGRYWKHHERTLFLSPE